ncbi:hypothetical protein ACFLYS_02730 [Chloroflexota bacterium]
MQFNIGNRKLLFFRALVVICVVLMIESFAKPWWTLKASELGGGGDAIRIYGYGLSHSMEEHREWVIEDETPLYQTVLAWVYIGVSSGLMLYSTYLKGKYGRWLFGGIGATYVIYALIAAFVVIAGRLEDFDIPLQGRSLFEMPANIIYLYSDLRFGYYLALFTGGMCITLALIRNIILRKSGLISDQ